MQTEMSELKLVLRIKKKEKLFLIKILYFEYAFIDELIHHMISGPNKLLI